MADIREQLTKYLTDAHSIGEQAIALLERGEVGGYEQLKRVARRAEDEQTVEAVDRILEQEREAARRSGAAFDAAVSASLASVGVIA